MDTPICDFLRDYGQREGIRLHMPGHKGRVLTGPEPEDITEIAGADELYHSRGVIRRSEENAAALFGAGRTVYSTEGSSLCIRAMLYLALLRAGREGLAPRLLAGRNAHRTVMTAAALLGLEVDWLWPEAEEPEAEPATLLSCPLTPAGLERQLSRRPYMAVWVTSPDYLGHQLDICGLAQVCHRHGTPLLVDQAHGAYLRFLPRDGHALSHGADACCDSAHKTLPCLTGTAYLHIGPAAPRGWAEEAEQAMSLFASTSPSYLLLRSLDRANAELDGPYPARLRKAAQQLEEVRTALSENGWQTVGQEAMKLTLAPKPRGYTGNQVGEYLRSLRMECEFADPDFVTLMPSAETEQEDFERVKRALLSLSARPPVREKPPVLSAPQQVCSLREALLAPREQVPVEKAVGRVFADAALGCPPAVPPVIAGERVSEEAVRCFQYYGVEQCFVLT